MHYLTLVVLPPGTPLEQADVLDGVGRLLAPYDQSIAGPEHDEECVCVEEAPDGRPDPGCRLCGGAGSYRCTCNRSARWDRWRLGGRWSGMARGLPRLGDVALGGVPADLFGGPHGPLVDNVVPVGRLHPPLVAACLAVVTPDGAWHQEGSLFPWERAAPDDTWRQRRAALLSAHAGCRAAVCDLHV